MMFSSNQVLEISGSLHDHKELQAALEFALKYSGHLLSFQNETKANIKCANQITADGRYCIGVSCDQPKYGWNEYMFDFDLSIISQIIAQFVKKQASKLHNRAEWDGSYELGFVMKAIPESLASEQDGIKNPFYGIVEFKPFICFYSK